MGPIYEKVENVSKHILRVTYLKVKVVFKSFFSFWSSVKDDFRLIQQHPVAGRRSQW